MCYFQKFIEPVSKYKLLYTYKYFDQRGLTKGRLCRVRNKNRLPAYSNTGIRLETYIPIKRSHVASKNWIPVPLTTSG